MSLTQLDPAIDPKCSSVRCVGEGSSSWASSCRPLYCPTCSRCGSSENILMDLSGNISVLSIRVPRMLSYMALIFEDLDLTLDPLL